MYSRFSGVVTLLAAIGLISLSGCGDTQDGYLLSGRVSYDGQPVSDGEIGFVAVDGTIGSYGGTDIVDGTYELPRSEGVTAGSYQVVIYAERPSGRRVKADEGSSEMIDQIEQYIPEIYNLSSSLKVDISGDKDDMDFELEKPKRKSRRR